MFRGSFNWNNGVVGELGVGWAGELSAEVLSKSVSGIGMLEKFSGGGWVVGGWLKSNIVSVPVPYEA